MSKENSTARRDASIPPRKVSLRREDSGYNSVIGTPAGTPAVGMSRRTSRVEQNRDPHLEGIPENYDHDQVILLDKLLQGSLVISYCKTSRSK